MRFYYTLCDGLMTISPALITAVLVQFGGHFAKNIAPLKSYFTDDPNWSISTTEWGMFQSAVVLPCTVFPWLIGHTVDGKGNVKAILVSALVIVCIGECIFILAVSGHFFVSALVARFIFGIGEGLVSSLSVFVATKFVPKYKMTAIGVTQAFHSLSVAVSKASLAYFANTFGSYIAALTLSLIVCIVSLCGGLLWNPPRSQRNRKPISCEVDEPNQHPLLSHRSQYTSARLCCQGRPGKLSLDFWLVAIIHLLVSSCHRLFGHIDAAFLQERFGHSSSVAGGVSSITEFVAVMVSPLLGLALDSYCTIHTLPVLLLLASCVGGLGYSLIAYSECSSTFLMVLLTGIGIVNGITPTVMKSVIPETVHENVLATAFGVYESSESFGVVFGSVAVGAIAGLYGGNYGYCVPIFGAGLFIATLLAAILVIRRWKMIRNISIGGPRSLFISCPVHDYLE